MQALPNMAGRTQPVRLAKVPLRLRRLHGDRLIKGAIADGDLTLAVDLKRAVEFPSEKIYWVPTEAVKRVLG